jgi:peptidoglycan/xylan/chitin deacetylase (PgdA/CDA1 family)
MSPLSSGILVISLDFELYWGVRDVFALEEYASNLLGVRKVVPALLQLFDQYGIHATWATVGFLFSRTKEELLAFAPRVRPLYEDPSLSPYNDISVIGASETEDAIHYAPSLIEMIRRSSSQEIASHTFSHYYCLEEGQDLGAFEADMNASLAIAGAQGDTLRSIVFPRNQINPSYLPACRRLRLMAYRGNPLARMYSPDKSNRPSRWKRALRLCDAYLNLSGDNSYAPESAGGGPLVNVRASRFLRPYSRPLGFLDGLRLRRIEKELTAAARQGRTYHLWWHPHNFGESLAENLVFLEAVLKHFDALRQCWGMESLTMGEFADRLARSHPS